MSGFGRQCANVVWFDLEPAPCPAAINRLHSEETFPWAENPSPTETRLLVEICAPRGGVLRAEIIRGVRTAYEVF